MRKFVIAAAVYVIARPELFGQAEAGKYLSDILVKRSAEKAAARVAEENAARLHSAAEALKDKVPDREEMDRILKDDSEKSEDRNLAEDIESCARKVLYFNPMKRAAKAARKSAIAEYVKPFSTVQSIYQSATDAFEAQLAKEAESFRKEPKNDLADVANCVIAKRIRNPLQRAVLQCGVTHTIKGQNCFADAMQQ